MKKLIPILFVLLLFAVIGGFVFSVNSGFKAEQVRRETAPCSAFSQESIRYVPVRCLSYFQTKDAGQ